MEYRVKENEGSKFKLTVTKDNELRIKVPKKSSEEDRAFWIKECLDIKEFLKGKNNYTIRKDVKSPYFSNLTLENTYEKFIYIKKDEC